MIATRPDRIGASIHPHSAFGGRSVSPAGLRRGHGGCCELFGGYSRMT
jgi:hypothetical protein